MGPRIEKYSPADIAFAESCEIQILSTDVNGCSYLIPKTFRATLCNITAYGGGEPGWEVWGRLVSTGRNDGPNRRSISSLFQSFGPGDIGEKEAKGFYESLKKDMEKGRARISVIEDGTLLLRKMDKYLEQPPKETS